MKWIVFTSPDFLSGEGDFINRLFDCGLDRLHFRKPGAPVYECERLIENIDIKWRDRIVVHDNFELCRRWHLGGVHLNSRNPIAPSLHSGTVSRSCHSLEALERYKSECDYLTLSPIFNSVSKQGYMAAFTKEELLEAKSCGIIDENVVALGGITLQNIPEARKYGFGGVAILGDVWNRMIDENVDDYLAAVRKACSDGER